MDKSTNKPEAQGQTKPAANDGLRNLTLAEQRLEFARSARAAAPTTSDASRDSNAEVATDEIETPAHGGDDTLELEQGATEASAGEETETPEDGNAASTAEQESDAKGDTSDNGTPPESEELPKSVRDLQKRVNKLTAEKKSLAEEKQLLEQRLSKDKTVQPPVPGPQAWVNLHEDVRHLDEQLASAEAVIQWVESNPDGGEVPIGDGKTRDLTEQEAKRWRQQAMMTLQKATAKREVLVDRLTRQAEDMQRKAQAEFQNHFAWATQPTSEESQAFASWREQLPWLEAYPDGLMMLGYAVEGFTRAKAGATRKQSGKAARRPEPTNVAVPMSSRAPSRVDGQQRELAAAEAAFRESGSMADMRRVEAIKQKLRSASTAPAR